jgi:glycosyltransferase involved in cell wall biosynthesis
MKIKFFTNIAPHYRSNLWLNLLSYPGWDNKFFYGVNIKSGIKNIDFTHEKFSPHKHLLHKVKNFWIKGKILIWQRGVIGQCLRSKFDHAIFLGEMYCLSTWIAAIICRMRGIQVTFWGHGIYGNEGIIKLLFRKQFYRLAHNHILYERRAKKLMVKNGFASDRLYVVFNSLDYDTHIKLREELKNLKKNDVFPFFTDPSLPVIVFVGRITPVKKLEMLLQAVTDINIDLTRMNLVIVGDGPYRKSLERSGKKGLEEGWLHFTGACYDEKEIGRYLRASDLCVSPGNVGLTAIHSLSFGTPVCTHGNLNNQMPEAEAITDGFNGFYFQEGNLDDLKEKIENWFSKNLDRDQVRNDCYQIIDRYYNPYYQLKVFEQLVNNEKPEI